MTQQKHGEIWNVVLAAGDGSRMMPLTRALCGAELPKQFAAFEGGRSLLQRTIERISPLAPTNRTVVVVGEACQDLAKQQLRVYPGLEVVVQPTNLGTGPGVLLPLARVLARDPSARVLVHPAAHHFARPSRLITAAQNALGAAARAPSGVAIVAVPGEQPATDAVWVVPGRRLGPAALGARALRSFVAQPGEAQAMGLLAGGALWSTSIFGGAAEDIWRLAARHLTRDSSTMDILRVPASQAPHPRLMRRLYLRLEPGDFGRDVLEKAEGLAVVCMVDAGWSDWNTPERLLETLERTAESESLFARAKAYEQRAMKGAR